MTAPDKLYRSFCTHCEKLGDNRKMLQLADGPWHDRCVTAVFTTSQILKLPSCERDKITVGAAGVVLVFRLLSARDVEVAKG